MPARLKLNAIVMLLVGFGFYWFFQFTKHDARVASIVPFGDDPSDAVGSFCLIVCMLLLIIAAARAFRPYRRGEPSAKAQLYLLRTEAAVPVAVLITLSGDGVAMLRSPGPWLGKPHSGELLALMAGMALVAAAGLVPIFRSARKLASVPERGIWRKPLLVWLGSAIVLAGLPGSLIESPLSHFLVLLLSDVLIAAPMAALTIAVAPDGTEPDRLQPSWWPWIVITTLGLAVGAFALAGEIFGEENGGIPKARLLLVAAMFIGAGMAVLLIAYGFLGRPLGLFQRSFPEENAFPASTSLPAGS